MGIRASDLPRDVLRAIYERCPEAKATVERDEVRTMVEPSIAIVDGKLVLMVAVETKNETNQRIWKAKNRRAGAAWRAVRGAIGSNLALLEPFTRHLAVNGSLRATFTRLGGRHLDVLANLGASFKGVEDAICYLLGLDDRDSRWHPIPAQDTEHDGVGVMVEIERI